MHDSSRARVMILVDAHDGYGHFSVVDQIVGQLVQLVCDVAVVSATFDRAHGLFEYRGAEIVGLPLMSEVDERTRFEAVMAACRTFRPTVVLFEFYPFAMRFRDIDRSAVEAFERESGVALELVSLSRDIVFSSAPGHAVEVLNRSFDRVLVRGEGTEIRLPDCMEEYAGIAIPVEYMGVVASTLPERTPGEDEGRAVIVSGGGGYRKGDDLFFRAAIAARRLSRRGSRRPWHVFVTADCADRDFDRLVRIAEDEGGRIRVRRNCGSRDFRQMLADAAAAIVRGGYNTTTELVQADVPFVVAPRVAAGVDREQSMRAAELERTGQAISVPADRIGEAEGPAILASALDEAVERSGRPRPRPRFDGAVRIARRLAELHGQLSATRSNRRNDDQGAVLRRSRGDG